MKQSRRVRRDPYYPWKIVNMILACAVLVLAALVIFGGKDGIFIPLAFFLGMLMCTFSGIMELAKSKRVVGYFCSIFAGILAVALIISVIQLL